MVEDNLRHIVYSKNVLEFVTVAGEFANLIENVENIPKSDFLLTAQKLLPLLYLKGSLLPDLENEYNEFVEKFVTEAMWNHCEKEIREKLQQHNEYLEVFDPDMSFSEGPVTASISENMADIYQDIKDFISTYRIGTTEIMNDALWECKDNFEHYWGQKILNVLRAIHMVIYSKDGTVAEESEYDLHNETGENKKAERKAFLTKMQQQYKKGNDEE